MGLKNKLDAAAEQSNRTIEEHVRTAIALHAKNTGLQNDLDVAKEVNGLLMKRVKDDLDTFSTQQTQLTSLEQEKSKTSMQLTMAKEKNSADLKSFQLEKDMLKAEINKGEFTVKSLKRTAAAAEEKFQKATEEHVETASALHAKIRDLQNDLGVATDNNETHEKRVKEVLNDLETKQAQFVSLEQEKINALWQLETVQEKTTANLASLQLEKDVLKVEIKKGEVVVESLQDKVDATEMELKKANKEHAETATSSKRRITDLQNDLGVAKEDNERLGRRMKDASDDLKAKQLHLVSLELEKRC